MRQGTCLAAKEKTMIDAIKAAIGLFSRIRFVVLTPVLLLTALSVHAEANFVRIPKQYIAALGDPQASSGTDAETWGLWAIDKAPISVFPMTPAV
jgi:hypothetical protein